MNNYTHPEIREFAANEANGTICEAALIAAKNLESAIYKRKAITSTERTAIEMLIQCAAELAEHIADKPIDNTRSMLPRELRDGLRREIVEAVIAKNPDRFTTIEHNDIQDAQGRVWKFNDKGFLYRAF